MNKITLEELNSITPILAINNVDSDAVFDYFRISSISKIKYEELASNPLYFILYAKQEEVENGWYVSPPDLRPYIKKIMSEHPNYTFLVDETMVDGNDFSNNKVILVHNIHQTMDDLYNYFMNTSHAKTVAITGSVGKTTCVGLIESILKQKYNVLRLYSKRITPLVLKSFIINLLNDDIDYLVTENSIYYHDHVQILASLLKPEIAAILNIESSHLGVDGLKTIDDICRYKSAIFQYAKQGYIIKGDPYLDRLTLEDGELKYDGEEVLYNSNLNLERIDLSKTTVEDEKFNIEGEIVVDPFMLSTLSEKQFTTAYKIGKYLGLNNEEIKAGMDNYQPVENRLQTEYAFGKRIIFDGDITTYERIKELSDNMYENKYLILRKVGSAENTFRIADIKEHFCKYKKVFIFSDVEYLEELKDEPNVEIVHDHSFMDELEGTIIYHYSGYYRVWDTYDENNLNEYDTEKYPIMKVK